MEVGESGKTDEKVLEDGKANPNIGETDQGDLEKPSAEPSK